MLKFNLTIKIVILFLCTITIILGIALGDSFYNFHNELKRIAGENQEMRIKVFWHLLNQKGSDIRILGDKLMVGDYVINGNYELPDRLKELCGGTATIFMNDMRVSTNVLKEDGSRAVGTKLEGAAYDAVFKEGKPYRGEADILGVHYFTAYDPIRNASGNLIGVLYTGVKRSDFFASFDRLIIRVVVFTILMAVLVEIGMLFILRKMVAKPIDEVVKSMRDIAQGEGDLTKRLLVRSKDEVGELALWFNKFEDFLEGVIIGVKNTTEYMDASTKEVAAGAQGLSQATQEQASAIEEVAATIEEMTSSIKHNAANASDGRERANDMVHMAHTIGEDAQHLVKAMGEISAASKKIGDIIITVNEVAFQTNLLALNAAVEAARAGEHGKGFAVVAEEVRALAQRSADASREIKTLIEDTVNKVNVGDAMVKKSGESVTQIAKRIQDLSQLMEEIAAASGEQASGVDELNRAIAQIDATTQQNASTVEELAGASDSLSSEAQQLSQTVARFKVSQGNTP